MPVKGSHCGWVEAYHETWRCGNKGISWAFQEEDYVLCFCPGCGVAVLDGPHYAEVLPDVG